jgi:hypothetical protein
VRTAVSSRTSPNRVRRTAIASQMKGCRTPANSMPIVGNWPAACASPFDNDARGGRSPLDCVFSPLIPKAQRDTIHEAGGFAKIAAITSVGLVVGLSRHSIY